MTPKKALELSQAAKNTDGLSYEGSLEERERALLYRLCGNAFALAQQLEKLQPKSAFGAVNQLWRLSAELQGVLSGWTADDKTEQKLRKKRNKTLEEWRLYVATLPVNLAYEAKLQKYTLQSEAKEKAAAKKAAVKKAPTKTVALAKKVAPAKKPAAKKVAAKKSAK